MRRHSRSSQRREESSNVFARCGTTSKGKSAGAILDRRRWTAEAVNLPYSIMEAMACSLPVVATAVGGVHDLIVDGQTGNLVAVDDDDAMAFRLKQLINDPIRAKALGAASNCRVQEQFSLAQSAERHFALYSEVSRSMSSGT